ncbi:MULTISPECIES: hypothetical protein [Aphanothece]|uniref:hypothetical protein n=1 Tax=Aphanothece TaxID=1121 RepID=UPI00398E7A54
MGDAMDLGSRDARPAPFGSDPAERLAFQLNTLTEVVETLTFRLLELEERMAAQDLRLQPLLESGQASADPFHEETELRLEDTEDRLRRLESVLNGLEAGGAARHLQPLDNPFPDEGEQPFMDELTA